MKAIIFIITVVFTVNIYAERQGVFGQKIAEKEDFNKHKCISFATTGRVEKLAYSELCKYGKHGCPTKYKNESSVSSYCFENRLSECFEKKSWITKNQLLELPDSIDIGLITNRVNIINGVVNNKYCGYYSPKKT